MNRKNLTAAVLAGLAGAAGIVGSAQAVNINPDGLGQVLIYPYYTVNGGNATLLSVVNTSEDAKAVKVRFMEGQNSQEVLDFNLYMSPFDVWVAAIFDNAGAPTLIVNMTQHVRFHTSTRLIQTKMAYVMVCRLSCHMKWRRMAVQQLWIVLLKVILK